VVRSSLEHIKMDSVQVWYLTPLHLLLPEKFKLTSHWVLATDNDEFLKRPEILKATTPWDNDVELIQWTDNFSSLFQVLRPKKRSEVRAAAKIK